MLDDKGAVVIWSFGLPGSTYEDNNRRGLQSAFAVVDALKRLGLSPRVGVTAGATFCGVVGAPHRCEYAVMGPCVNLAARLMCACAGKGDDVRVLCNDTLRDRVIEKGFTDFEFTSYVGLLALSFVVFFVNVSPAQRATCLVFPPLSLPPPRATRVWTRAGQATRTLGGRR